MKHDGIEADEVATEPHEVEMTSCCNWKHHDRLPRTFGIYERDHELKTSGRAGLSTRRYRVIQERNIRAQPEQSPLATLCRKKRLVVLVIEEQHSIEIGR